LDRILVVDDKLDNVTLAKTILERAGYEVDTATDGDEAVMKAGAKMPDLILLDAVMPKKSGLLVCKVLKSQAKTEHIPVVMFTDPGSEVDERVCVEAGATGFFLKPFNREPLLQEVANQLDRIRGWRFSKPLDLQHEELKGEKILLEFTSDLPYERCVRNFALEGCTHGEKVLVFTAKSSVISQALKGDEGVEIIPLTEERNISSTLEAHVGKQIDLVYDNISDRILTSGFKDTYDFLRKMLELLGKSNVTAVFLINPEFHPENEMTIIRDLFNKQFNFGKNGLTKIQ
jgi:DNA-binding response OmpR family regulator